MGYEILNHMGWVLHEHLVHIGQAAFMWYINMPERLKTKLISLYCIEEFPLILLVRLYLFHFYNFLSQQVTYIKQ